MDGLFKLTREAQLVLGGGLLLLLLSFLDWQVASIPAGFLEGGSIGVNEWHGIGILAGLLVIAMLAWEVLRLIGANVSVGPLSPGLVSVGLALLAALFTLIAFLNKSFLRHWPAWVALLVAVVVAVAAVMRARAEGVEMPQVSTAGSAGSTGSTGSAEPSGYPEPAAPAEPAGSAEPTDPPDPSSE